MTLCQDEMDIADRIIASDLPEDLFEIKDALEAIYDNLESGGRNPFEGESAKAVLDDLWEEYGSNSGSIADLETGEPSTKTRRNGVQRSKRGDRVDSVRILVEGRGTVPVSLPYPA